MLNIEHLYTTYIRGRQVTTDSRSIKQGDVFIALRGDKFDGNAYALQALEAGASAAFVDDEKYRSQSGCVYVDDCLRFLQQAARYHREQLGIPILGITGTNGKTTTKELCHAVLSVKYKTHATQGNLNNHIGVPLTLLAMDESVRIGIVEMGANHPGEIRMLCEIADPDFGLITNIGEAHLEGFGSYENIVRTKNELYEYIAAKKGKLFVNADDALLMRLSEGIERTTYGQVSGNTKGEIKQNTPFLVFALKTLKGDLYVKTRLIGGYNFSNALAAACVGNFFDIPTEQIKDALEAYEPSNLRSQLKKTERNILILDTYNANPSSMKAALENFREFRADHKIIVLGEMLELGQESEKAHQEIVETAIQSGVDQLFLVGRSFGDFGIISNFIVRFGDTEALIGYLKKNNISSSAILIKGSRGNRLERIVEYL